MISSWKRTSATPARAWRFIASRIVSVGREGHVLRSTLLGGFMATLGGFGFPRVVECISVAA